MTDRGARLYARSEPAARGPLVLGIESAGLDLGLALGRLAEAPDAPDPSKRPTVPAFSLVDEVQSHLGRRHAERFLDLLEAMLDRHELRPADIALVACGRGPGSFTGVRVGLASAAGLALGLGCPLWPVDTLAALARHAAGYPGIAIPMVDARKSEVFAAAYRVPLVGPPVEVAPARAGSAEAVLAALQAACGGEPSVVFGSGALLYGCAANVPPAWHTPRAFEVAWLAAEAFDAAGRDPARAPALDPAYIRASDAELALELSKHVVDSADPAR